MSSDYSTQEYICGTILLCTTTVSFLCTILTLYLIYDLNVWNGHILLVYILTLFQLLYDLSFYFLIGFRQSVFYAFYKFLAITSGTFVSLWINFISLILYYTIIHLESFDIKRHYWKVLIANVFVSLSLASVVTTYYLLNDDNNNAELVFYWLRIASIAFNLIIYIITTIYLQEVYFDTRFLTSPTKANMPAKSTATTRSSLQPMDYHTMLRVQTRDLLLVLSNRLKYYPVVQIISLAGAAWWEYRYGFETDSFDNTSFTIGKEASLYLFTFCSPTAGAGYFIVFLLVQPLVYERLRKLVKQFLISIHCYRCCISLKNNFCFFRRTGRNQSNQTSYDHSVDYIGSDMSGAITTKDLFAAASQRPIDRGEENSDDKVIPSDDSGNNFGFSVNPLIEKISPEFDLDQYRNKIISSDKDIRRSVQFINENLKESETVNEDKITINQRTSSSDGAQRSRTKSGNSVNRKISFTIPEEDDEKDSISAGITQSPKPSETSIPHTSQSTGKFSHFTIDRPSYQKKLQNMNEDALWEEFKKIKKENLDQFNRSSHPNSNETV